MPIDWNAPNPAHGNTLPHIPLERLKPAGKIEGAITCHTVLGVNLHFVGNRTLPCTKPNCPGCDQERRKIWEGYLSIWTRSPSRHIITALTPGAALMLSDEAQDRDALRGWYIRITRSGTRPNGRVLVHLEPATIAAGVLPPAPDIPAHLLKIWNLDPETMPENHPFFPNRHNLLDMEPPRNGTRLGPLEPPHSRD